MTRPSADDIATAIRLLDSTPDGPDRDAACRVLVWLEALEERREARAAGCNVRYLRMLKTGAI